MKFLTWQNPEQLFVAQGIIKVKIYSVAELRFIIPQVALMINIIQQMIPSVVIHFMNAEI